MVEATDAAGAVTWREIVRLSPAELRERVRGVPGDWSRDPAALLALAAGYRSPGAANPYASQPYVDAAEELLLENGDHRDDALRVLAPVLRASALRGLGRFTASLDQLARAEALLSASTVPLPGRAELEACISLEAGLSLLLAGRLADARRALLRALYVAEARTPPAVLSEAGGGIALIDLRLGSLRSADMHVDAALRAASEADPSHGLGTALARLAEAALAIERDELDGLERRLRALAADTAGTEYAPLALAELAAMREDGDEVDDLLQELQLVVSEWEAPNLAAMLHDDQRIATLVQRREAVAARAEIARLAPDPAHSQCPAAWSARVAIDAGESTHAIDLTARCLAMGDAHAPRTTTLALLVTAAAHADLGDASTAEDLFDHAVTLAATGGSIRPFGVLRRHELAMLLERRRARHRPDPADRLISAVEARYPTADAPRPETLSARERVVLSRLIEGDTHQRIAFDLSVSPNTVKTQVRSIYRKLGVTTRDGAVQRARHLGLID
ncbi:LuxR C-terminal-related transcriptional regulator [Agromyces aurantiacus]|uniref:LuxR C-terminal-related transcriptional regulator n=1 Tax=Agromyces aurantiacus TaxID=165814 RepID=A0ABV9R3V5_9MICO|nr:LuxR C-terminal-related transcriptional regulator [Agromyces aurantiacus]